MQVNLLRFSPLPGNTPAKTVITHAAWDGDAKEAVVNFTPSTDAARGTAAAGDEAENRSSVLVRGQVPRRARETTPLQDSSRQPEHYDAPNDQYLCIVLARSPADTGAQFLPFEGDATLSLILSKALLLAADDKITDPAITRQL